MGANSHGQLGQECVSEQCNLPSLTKTTWSGKVHEIACGGGHALLINDEGKLYACGWNHRRQLGFEIDQCDTFTRVWDLSGIFFTKVSAGWDFSAAISDKNVIYLWGSNEFGQLGFPTYDYPKSVRPIQLELKIKDVSMGLRHTVLLDVNGNVWTTGYGKRGQLGHGEDVTSSDRFQKIDGLNKIAQIACGQHHTLAWSENGSKLYAWGDNAHGQLGTEKLGTRAFIPTEVVLCQNYFKSITRIFSGWTNNAILLDNGEAVYWGRNNYGQLGCANSSEYFNIVQFKGCKIKRLALGSEHSICLLDNNTLHSWGWNEHGNAGTGTTENVTTPTEIILKNLDISYISAGAGFNFVASTDPSVKEENLPIVDGKLKTTEVP